MDKNDLKKRVKVSGNNGNGYRNSLAVEATEVLEFIRQTRPELYDHVLAEAKRQEEAKGLVLVPQNSTSVIKIADKTEIEFEPIEKKHYRFLKRPWDLGMILDKINFTFAGVKEIVDEDLQRAFQFLPTKKQQREGLTGLDYHFNTADEKVYGSIVYDYYNSRSSSSLEWSTKAGLTVKNFTEQDIEEYNRLKIFIEKGKK